MSCVFLRFFAVQILDVLVDLGLVLVCYLYTYSLYIRYDSIPQYLDKMEVSYSRMIHRYTHTHTHIYIYIYICLSLYMCVSIYIYIYMCVCLYIYIYIYMYMYA